MKERREGGREGKEISKKGMSKTKYQQPTMEESYILMPTWLYNLI